MTSTTAIIDQKVLVGIRTMDKLRVSFIVTISDIGKRAMILVYCVSMFYLSSIVLK
jgi:hypothetical protein